MCASSGARERTSRHAYNPVPTPTASGNRTTAQISSLRLLECTFSPHTAPGTRIPFGWLLPSLESPLCWPHSSGSRPPAGGPRRRNGSVNAPLAADPAAGAGGAQVWCGAGGRGGGGHADDDDSLLRACGHAGGVGYAVLPGPHSSWPWAGLPPPMLLGATSLPAHAACRPAVKPLAVATTARPRLGASDVNAVGLKDVPLRSLFPEEPLPPVPVGVLGRGGGDWIRGHVCRPRREAAAGGRAAALDTTLVCPAACMTGSPRMMHA